MRVVFVGSSRFGLRCLTKARGLSEVEITGVITNEQTFNISYAPESVSNVLYADMGAFAREVGIPCYVMRERMTESDLLAQVDVWRPDLFLVVGWYHMVPRRLREVAPALGLHASLLPDYSGGAPLVWAMINGEKVTGITLFQLGDGVDDGPVLGQASTEIRGDDTIATLYARIEDLGLDLLKTHLPALAKGEGIFARQDERHRRTFPQRKPADGIIDWERAATQIYDFIRAQTKPYPGAYMQLDGECLTVWKATTLPDVQCNHRAGYIFRDETGRLLAACGDRQCLNLTEVRWLGKDMTGAEWAIAHADLLTGRN